MKKQKFNKKLSLNKETISKLDEIKGGANAHKTPNCLTNEHSCTCPPSREPATCTPTICGPLCP